MTSDDRLRELASDCVHCGFCLPSCPTYQLWGEEMDSPRGRIHLMRQHLDGEPLTETMVGHLDRCLGCMACVTACPSGVQYDVLLEATRVRVEQEYHRPPRERLLRRGLFAVFPRPRRLAALRGPLRLYQRSGLRRLVRRSGVLRRLPREVAVMEGLLPDVDRAPAPPLLMPARGERRARGGLLLGCVQRSFFPRVNAATARVLVTEGCEVVAPRSQGCCGALSSHAGRRREAQRYARRLIAEFERAEVDVVVVDAAGCGSALKEYGALLGDDDGWAARAAAFAARVRDVSEWLVELGPVAPRGPVPLRIAYADACHLAHAQGIRAQPRELLEGIPGLELRPLVEPDMCCGSAGVYNVLQPDAARALGDRKAGHVAASGAELLVSANPGCLMQIETALRRQGSVTATAHLVEVLDASLHDPAPLLRRAMIREGDR